jgi:hypothetical protein
MAGFFYMRQAWREAAWRALFQCRGSSLLPDIMQLRYLSDPAQPGPTRPEKVRSGAG